MSEFNVAKFVANNAGLNIFDALNKAYQQGRADKEKELQGIKDLGSLYSEIRADERAKTIEECIGLLEKYHIYYDGLTREVEQLKEKNND